MNMNLNTYRLGVVLASLEPVLTTLNKVETVNIACEIDSNVTLMYRGVDTERLQGVMSELSASTATGTTLARFVNATQPNAVQLPLGSRLGTYRMTADNYLSVHKPTDVVDNPEDEED